MTQAARARVVGALRGRAWDAASVVALCGALCAGLCLWPDYGMAWDETVHMEYGDALASYFASWGHDREALWHRDARYGPGYDLLGAVVRAVSPWPDYPTMRLLGLAVGLLSLVGGWRLGRLLAGPLAGFLSLVLLALTPAFFGEWYSNCKDLPFAASYVWALYYLARAAGAFPRVPGALWLKLGVVLGLAASTRIGGLLGWCYLGALVLTHGLSGALGPRPWRAQARETARLFCQALACCGLAWALLVALWPAAQSAPALAVVRSVGRFGKYSAWNQTTLYDGAWLKPVDLPWDYVPQYLLRKLPEVISLLASAFFLRAFYRLARAVLARRAYPLAEGLLAVSVLLPLVFIVARGMRVYDGMRHVLFLVPPLCVAAGCAASGLFRRVSRRPALLAFAVALSLLVLSHPVRHMAQLHPYEYLYYNYLTGGFERADGRWDADYYGRSYRELYESLADKLWQTAPDLYLNTHVGVTGNHRREFLLTDLVVSDFHFTGRVRYQEHQFFRRRRPTFFGSYTRHGWHLKHPKAPVVVRVTRQGRLLGWVRALRAGPWGPGEEK